MTEVSFAELGLAEPICRALAAENYTHPTPIQTRAIPLLLEGRDLLAIAQTGTGKTAAFALPLLQILSKNQKPAVPHTARALILAPTRELAVQIGESITAYGRNLRLRHTVIFGGVSQFHQIKALARGVDIVVATPGRLLDLVEQRQLRLDDVQHFVLDEADRMLDMGFAPDMRKIVAKLPKIRQSLLFSATMPNIIAKLAADLLHQPARVEVTPQVVTVDRIEQRLYFVEANQKRSLLFKLLDDPALSRVIVFTRTKHHANRVSEYLEDAGIPSDAIHGNKSQNARQRALERLRSGDARVLVATDIAARGIDVDNVSHVINYELPNEPESYVHRIGRTARAGTSGIALSFCDRSERSFLRDIERLTKRPLIVEQLPEGLESQPVKSRPPHAKVETPAKHHRPKNHGAHSHGSKNHGQTSHAPKGEVATKGERAHVNQGKPAHTKPAFAAEKPKSPTGDKRKRQGWRNKSGRAA
ncbi:MAG TPA: DEAD/DEAH box helicase [Methylovirgula sp.]|nr:DEAD/DEAH box helicase [Methylovirgula sp.]